MPPIVNVDTSELPVCACARFGGQRGAMAGAFFFALIWLRAGGGNDPTAPSVQSPWTSAAAMVVGFAIAGSLLLVAQRHVRSLLAAIGVGIGCSIPVWLAVLAVTRGLSLPILPLLGGVSLLSGAIWGTMSWKDWLR